MAEIVDVVYRTGLQTLGVPQNKLISNITIDGFTFKTSASLTAEPVDVVIYGFNNTTPYRITSDPSITVTYSGGVDVGYYTCFPRLYAKSFMIEWRYLQGSSSNVASFVDFYGNIYVTATPSTRLLGTR